MAKMVGNLSLYERKDRKRSRYGVAYKDGDGKYIRRTFETAEERKEYILAHKLGDVTEPFSVLEWQRWLEIKRLCHQHDVTPELAFTEWEKLRPPVVGKSLGAAAEEYLKSRSDLAKDNWTHDRLLMGRMVGTIGAGVDMRALSKAQIEQFLHDLTAHPVTFKNNRNRARAFFTWAKRRGYLVESPAAEIELLPMRRTEPGILTVDQTAALFAANAHNAEVCALLALGAFAGIRTSGIDRLSPDEIRLDEKQIYFPAAKFKTRRSHLIEHAPENLWAWLGRANLKAMCAMSARNKAYAREGAYVAAGLLVTKAAAKREKIKPKAPPHNALRHSFATYKCALDGSAERASYILGHTNPAEIWQSYKGIATKADAERYFAIAPSMSTAKTHDCNDLSTSDA